MKGGDGGNGERVSICSRGWTDGGIGGKGEVETYIVKINTTSSFSYKIGKKGEDGTETKNVLCDAARGGNGKQGETTAFEVNSERYIAFGGGGGTGGYEFWTNALPDWEYGERGRDGDEITHDGNDGYIKIYKCI